MTEIFTMDTVTSEPTSRDANFFKAPPSESSHALGGINDFLQRDIARWEREVPPPSAFVHDNEEPDLFVILKSLDSVGDKLYQLKAELVAKQLDDSSADLTSVNSLEKRLEMLEGVRHHVGAILNNRGGILSRLQQPWTGNFIVMESENHASFVKLLESASEMLKNLPELLQSLRNAQTFSAELTEVDSVLRAIPGLLAKYQRYVEALASMRNAQLRQLEIMQ